MLFRVVFFQKIYESVQNWVSPKYFVYFYTMFLVFHLGGVFKLELFLPEEYPMAAPKVSKW